MTRCAIIAGSGNLPQILAKALVDPVYVTLSEVSVPAGVNSVSARVEKLGRLFKDLSARDVSEVCFAGAMVRPKINPVLLDRHALKLTMFLGKGDDALLREVINLFESQGFSVKGASDICPELVLDEQTNWGRIPSGEDKVDISRAEDILAALSPHDVGQGAVVAGGQVLGIETLQGTDALLGFVAQTPDHLRRSPGVFVKRPKQGKTCVSICQPSGLQR